MKPNNFLQDDQGNFSSTRLMFIFLILNGVGMGWYTLVHEGSIMALALLSGAITAATGMKFAHKSQETKPEDNTDEV